MAKNIIIFILLLIVLAGGAYQFGTKKLGPTPTPTSTTQPTIVPEATLAPAPQATDMDEIKQAMATKHSKSVADTQITIETNTGVHAKGLVKFAGEIAGGWFLAVKTTGPWQIAADGNGTVLCGDIDPFNFPTTMVPECWDEIGQQLITR
ncbi:hypothetical protein ACFL1M_01150 [Patescibacteria group bacterium]